MSFRNIAVNLMRGGFATVIFSKLIKRFERDSSADSLNWAAQNSQMTTEEFCKSINADLWHEAQMESARLSVRAQSVLGTIPFDLGGGGIHPLLYFMVRQYKPDVVIETGVAAGWSSSAILSALDKNRFGQLFSSDFPYFRISRPEQYIGILVEDDLKKIWNLDIRGDTFAIPAFKTLLGPKQIDMLHYDSDKSYSGRKFVIDCLLDKLSDDAILLIDDIHDNLHFKDFVTRNNLKYQVFLFEGKYSGLVLSVGRQLRNNNGYDGESSKSV